MALTWRDFAQSALFILGILALMYAAMISSSPELVFEPQVKSELPRAPT
jgi:hypothetical protein